MNKNIKFELVFMFNVLYLGEDGRRSLVLQDLSTKSTIQIEHPSSNMPETEVLDCGIVPLYLPIEHPLPQIRKTPMNKYFL